MYILLLVKYNTIEFSIPNKKKATKYVKNSCEGFGIKSHLLVNA